MGVGYEREKREKEKRREERKSAWVLSNTLIPCINQIDGLWPDKPRIIFIRLHQNTFVRCFFLSKFIYDELNKNEAFETTSNI